MEKFSVWNAKVFNEYVYKAPKLKKENMTTQEYSLPKKEKSEISPDFKTTTCT